MTNPGRNGHGDGNGVLGDAELEPDVDRDPESFTETFATIVTDRTADGGPPPRDTAWDAQAWVAQRPPSDRHEARRAPELWHAEDDQPSPARSLRNDVARRAGIPWGTIALGVAGFLVLRRIFAR